KKKPPPAPDAAVPHQRDAAAQLPHAAPHAGPPAPQAAPHPAQQKPSWAAPDETMQISLGGRKK
ncbi:hypothetical protein, partial [Streptomyces sp. SID337]